QRQLGQAVARLHRLDEEHLQRAQRVLAEQPEEHHADDDGDGQREQRRQQRHRTAGVRARLQAQAHAPASLTCASGSVHNPLIHCPIISTLARAVVTDGDSRPCAMTCSRSVISNSSSSSSLTTSSAQPASRSFSSSARIWAAAPTSTPHVGCATISRRGFASISRPTMNFCKLPPDRLFAGASGPPALTF